MPIDPVQQISFVEERLRLAMLASDCPVLGELISPELIFTNHLGQVCGKQDDLSMHRDGLLKLHTLEPSEVRVQAKGDLAVVSVRMKVGGTFNNTAFQEDLRYTRVWEFSGDGRWEILTGHSSRVQR